MMHGEAAGGGAVSGLDADPDLGQDIPPQDHDEAHRRAVARCVQLERPRWDPTELSAEARPGWLGLLLTEGLLVRSVGVAHRTSCEVLGPGDVLRPWDEDADYDPLTVVVEWLVLEPARLGVLDERFALRMARWPSIAAAIMARVAARARYLTLSAAITHQPRTDARLLLVFSVLADRWGRVTPGGTVIRLPLTHQMLGMLTGSHRPSVTIGLQRLTRDGLIIRQASDRWLLTDKGKEQLRSA